MQAAVSLIPGRNNGMQMFIRLSLVLGSMTLSFSSHMRVPTGSRNMSQNDNKQIFMNHSALLSAVFYDNKNPTQLFIQ